MELHSRAGTRWVPMLGGRTSRAMMDMEEGMLLAPVRPDTGRKEVSVKLHGVGQQLIP